jgi:hypothetical protein
VALELLLDRARAGQRVEIGCYGGHGRTGTALACLAILCATRQAKQSAGYAPGTANVRSRPTSKKPSFAASSADSGPVEEASGHYRRGAGARYRRFRGSARSHFGGKRKTTLRLRSVYS